MAVSDFEFFEFDFELDVAEDSWVFFGFFDLPISASADLYFCFWPFCRPLARLDSQSSPLASRRDFEPRCFLLDLSLLCDLPLARFWLADF